MITNTFTPIRTQLGNAINNLPTQRHQDKKFYVGEDANSVRSVLREWVMRLPLRHQGVLMTAIRGCDGAPKEDSSKHISRMIRRACLNPADERETLNCGGFFGFDRLECFKNVLAFMHSLDQYPLHYVMHLMHASEVIAYKNPEEEFRIFFMLIYEMMVHMLHLNIETAQAMDQRLTLDRVAAGTTERDF